VIASVSLRYLQQVADVLDADLDLAYSPARESPAERPRIGPCVAMRGPFTLSRLFGVVEKLCPAAEAHVLTSHLAVFVGDEPPEERLVWWPHLTPSNLTIYDDDATLLRE
jgi:hypothetical protein